jgi:hypothetical protein
MALDAENSIPIIFVDQIICNSNFYLFLKAQTKCGRGGGGGGEYMFWVAWVCGGVLRRK